MLTTAYIKESLSILERGGVISKTDKRKITDNKLKTDKKFRNSLVRKINRNKKKLEALKEDRITSKKINLKEDRQALRSRGYEVNEQSKRAFVSKKQEEIVKISRRGDIVRGRAVRNQNDEAFMELINEPNINIHAGTLQEELENYASIYPELSGNRVAFTYYGNLSKKSFSNVRDALLELLRYIAIAQGLDNPALLSEDLHLADYIKDFQLTEYIPYKNMEYGKFRSEFMREVDNNRLANKPKGKKRGLKESREFTNAVERNIRILNARKKR